MPSLNIKDIGSYEIASGKRLINAIIDDAAADQHYSCGGNAKCTSCRVEFLAGEPQKITEAEKALLAANGLDQTPGIRLTCQMLCENDMTIKLLVPKPPAKNPAHPTVDIQPPPVWTSK